MEEKKIWKGTRKQLYLDYESPSQEKLEKVIYTVKMDPFGRPFLEFMEEKYFFEYKLYGLESKLISRIERTYNSTEGNMGVLFNGLKGTGKSVTAKQICNRMNLPVILVTNPELISWVNEIPEDIVMFIDEYEKIFKERDSILSVMDGALESVHRRIFLLTTNQLSINENLIHRPGRIRYLKTFKDLSPEIVTEIVEDCLVHRELTAEVISFCSSLEAITIDVVKSVCEECNIHHESPKAFEDIFNVKKLSGKVDISVVIGEKVTKLFKSVKAWPREFNDEMVGENFYITEQYVGRLSEVVDRNICKIEFEDRKERIESNFLIRKLAEMGISLDQITVSSYNEDQEEYADYMEDLIDVNPSHGPSPHEIGRKLREKREKREKEIVKVEITLHTEDSYIANYVFRYKSFFS
jgi:SpoVK/Ycf46/Vps4 family AAA+-type ATPase